MKIKRTLLNLSHPFYLPHPYQLQSIMKGGGGDFWMGKYIILATVNPSSMGGNIKRKGTTFCTWL
jgi:hypothetical protein